jgi:hypothetical protein
MLENQIANLCSAAPAHRDACAAVTVVVDDEFRSDALYLEILLFEPEGIPSIRTDAGEKLAIRRSAVEVRIR